MAPIHLYVSLHDTPVSVFKLYPVALVAPRGLDHFSCLCLRLEIFRGGMHGLRRRRLGLAGGSRVLQLGHHVRIGVLVRLLLAACARTMATIVLALEEWAVLVRKGRVFRDLAAAINPHKGRIAHYTNPKEVTVAHIFGTALTEPVGVAVVLCNSGRAIHALGSALGDLGSARGRHLGL